MGGWKPLSHHRMVDNTESPWESGNNRVTMGEWTSQESGNHRVTMGEWKPQSHHGRVETTDSPQ